MAFNIEKIIGDLYSALSSPAAQWAREGLAKEKELALDNEQRRKRNLLQMQEEGQTQRAMLTDQGATARQRLINEGELEKQNSANAGLLARQRLANEASIYGADQSLAGQIYASDQGLSGVKYNTDMLRESSKNSGLNELIKAHSAVLNDATASPEQKSESMKFLRSQTDKVIGGVAGDQPDGLIPDKPPDLPNPARNILNAPGNIPQNSATAAPGAKSMDFPVNTGRHRPMTQEEGDKYLGMLPGVRVKKKGFFESYF